MGNFTEKENSLISSMGLLLSQISQKVSHTEMAKSFTKIKVFTMENFVKVLDKAKADTFTQQDKFKISIKEHLKTINMKEKAR